MADEPIEALGGKTPLEYADTPEMDRPGKNVRNRHGSYHSEGDGSGQRYG